MRIYGLYFQKVVDDKVQSLMLSVFGRQSWANAPSDINSQLQMGFIYSASEIYDLTDRKCYKHRTSHHNSDEANHEANFLVFDEIEPMDTKLAAENVNKFFGRSMVRIIDIK